RALGAPVAKSVKLSPEQLARILKNYRILFPKLRSLDLVGLDCTEIASSRIDTALKERCKAEPAVATAVNGKVFLGEIKLSDDFAPVMTIAVPVEVAGEPLGAIVADIDMVAIRETLNSIRVGQTGYARLVSRDGTLIGHGDPEERRHVLLREKDAHADAIRNANPDLGARYQDSQGRDVIALSA